MISRIRHRQVRKKNLGRAQQVIFTELLPAGYCQRGFPFTSSGSRTEFVWKRDIRLGCKALRLNAEQANPIENVQLGKLAVVEAFTKNKALTDFQAEQP